MGYLLSTPANEVFATGLLRIKRELLLALADKERFTTKAGGKTEVYDKYQKWAVGREEADWHGLTLEEAKKKQARMEAEQVERETVPDKMRYRKEMVELDLELADERNREEKGGLQGMFGGISKVFKK